MQDCTAELSSGVHPGHAPEGQFWTALVLHDLAGLVLDGQSHGRLGNQRVSKAVSGIGLVAHSQSQLWAIADEQRGGVVNAFLLDTARNSVACRQRDRP